MHGLSSAQPSVWGLDVFLLASFNNKSGSTCDNQKAALNNPFVCPYLPVSFILALLGHHVAAARAIPSCLRILWDIPGSAMWQYPHLTLRHLPVQLSSSAGEAKHGKCHTGCGYYLWVCYYMCVHFVSSMYARPHMCVQVPVNLKAWS